MGELRFFGLVLLYCLAARAILAGFRGAPWRDPAFAGLNVVTVCGLFFGGLEAPRPAPWLAAYVLGTAMTFLLLRLAKERGGNWVGLAVLAPLGAMCAAKATGGVLLLVGISYMAFRLSYLVLEVRNELAPLPSLSQYLAFAFFPPTMAIGPISGYAGFHQSLQAPATPESSPARAPTRALTRIGCGLIKFSVLAPIFKHAGGGLIAPFSYYLFLYCDFSGFCDVAIGAADLIGIRVDENFDRPFSARNVKDFWNRWHITLSVYTRNMVFYPLTKGLMSRLDARWADHIVAFSVACVFVLIGAWHGLEWHYLAFGVMHATGVVANHYYTIILKNRLGRERFKAYNSNRAIRAVAVVTTFVFVAASLYLFAHGDEEIMRVLRR